MRLYYILFVATLFISYGLGEYISEKAGAPYASHTLSFIIELCIIIVAGFVYEKYIHKD